MIPNEPTGPAPRRHAALIYGAFACGIAFGAGLEVKAYVDQDRETQARAAWAATMERSRTAAAEREAHLNQIIEDERGHHADALRQRDAYVAAFTARNVGMRHDLEAMLADSRSSGERCTARVAGIAEAVGALLEAVGEGAGLLDEAQRANRRLTAENRKLYDQVVGWQRFDAERRIPRITVKAKKPVG